MSVRERVSTVREPMRRVAVLVPAHDEQELLSACLRSVRASLAASDAQHIVVVAAHRCADATAAVAREALAGCRHVVLVDDTSRTVAEVRRGAARTALAALGDASSSTWLLSTDADSVVPLDWINAVAAHADRGARAIAGLAHIDSRELDEPARSRYRALVASRVHGRTHEHVYGANLAVRADAYVQVGGFPLVPLGEDTALVETLERQGIPVRRATDLVVATSGRLHGRAHGGLADLLARLSAEDSSRRSTGTGRPAYERLA